MLSDSGEAGYTAPQKRSDGRSPGRHDGILEGNRRSGRVADGGGGDEGAVFDSGGENLARIKSG